MKNQLINRISAGVATGALAAAALATMPTPASAAVKVPAPEAAAAATWLASQLVDGTIPSNTGGTIDFAIGLNSTGASPAVTAAVQAGLDAKLEAWVGTDPTKNGARRAKAAYYYATVGLDATAAGAARLDLVAPLNDAVDDTTGAFADSWNQAWAVLGLGAVQSSEGLNAAEYLAGLQCADGAIGYRAGCTAGETFNTAMSAVALAPFKAESPVVANALTRAVAWLKDEQSANGGFQNCETYSADWSTCELYSENTNDTGLAAWALGVNGELGAAARAAIWVAGHQITTVPGCGPAKVGHGALMWTAQQYAAGLDDDNASTTQLSTAQGLGALAYLAKSQARVNAPTGFVAAGSKVTASVSGLRAGQQACLNGGKSPVLVKANGKIAVTVTAGTKSLALSALGVNSKVNLKVLGAAKLKAVVKAKAKRGKSVKVTVRGLAAGEQVTVKLRGKRVASAKAAANGTVVVKFKTKKKAKLGSAKIVVTGQFANRVGTTKVRIIR